LKECPFWCVLFFSRLGVPLQQNRKHLFNTDGKALKQEHVPSQAGHPQKK